MKINPYKNFVEVTIQHSVGFKLITSIQKITSVKTCIIAEPYLEASRAITMQGINQNFWEDGIFEVFGKISQAEDLSTHHTAGAVFSIQVLKKAPSRLRLVLFTLTYFFIYIYTYTLLFCSKIKHCCDCCFPQQIRPQVTVQLNILQDCSIERTGFNMINKHHILPIIQHVSLNLLSFNHYRFSQS